jgi:opacity protein-like surface antigen
MQNRIRLALAAAAAVLVSAAAAPAAMAAPDAGACAYVGSANTNGVQWFGQLPPGLPAGLQLPFPFSTNNGTYGFTQFVFICAGADVGAPDADVVELTLKASGDFSNIICGTGTANGTATVTNAVSLVGPPLSGAVVADLDGSTINYVITFVAGQGTITGSGMSGADHGQVTLAGTASIEPTGGGDTPEIPAQGSDCTDNFEVEGAAALVVM